MNKSTSIIYATLLVFALPFTLPCWAFDSGSTGVDGELSPTSDVNLVLPDNGIFNFTTVNIPQGVTVTFTRNQLNTPAVILAQGDMLIDGVIDVSGVDANDGILFPSLPLPPGGFSGGQPVGPGNDGAHGLGPGGGQGGLDTGGRACGGSGAGFGENGSLITDSFCKDAIFPGTSYGSETLQPLLGGSGGGSGANNSSNQISQGGGGSGGGSLLIAASGSVTVNGQLDARGGTGDSSNTSQIGSGGGGSGGGIRLLATSIIGGGTVYIAGGLRGSGSYDGSTGGNGRIRMEAESINFTGNIVPQIALSVTAIPSSVFVSNIPSLRITQIAGSNVPAIPSGTNDVILPSDLINPVTIQLAASNVPVGDTIQLTVTPAAGAIETVTSTPLAGTESSSTATAEVNLPAGASVLSASVSFTVSAAVGNALSTYAQGEPVQRIELISTAGASSKTTLITASGNTYTWPGGMTAAMY